MSRNVVVTTGAALTVQGVVREDGLGVNLDVSENHGKSVSIPMDKQPMAYVLVPAETLEALLAPRAPAVSDAPKRKPAKKAKVKKGAKRR